MEINSIQNKLVEVLSDCSFFEDVKSKLKNEFTINTSIFNELNVESIQFLEFIIHIEKSFNISLDFDNLEIENFETIEKLSKTLLDLGV